ncbi:glutaredoxin-C9-like [Olea europaea var. sylvestris]|uniref:Glutaredoxin-C9-like n=1 Tax=Olea europaea subsp. europaea TaxID=158383 RepID=A0A8S0SAF6_OLEEU|nr:glutaredoxin-C9-like [Olea europaea var. sylvestris]CAA2988161.1 glutaredoxin-C9-like [Olea europaea subsp. europaea]
MQKALQYRDWLSTTTGGGATNPPPGNIRTGDDDEAIVKKLVTENAVVVFARRGCCMCHVVKLLLHGHGVNPTLFDVDEQNEAAVMNELSKIITAEEGSSATGANFPAVVVGGKLLGGLEEIMGAHISGELVPRLREAGALWL